jgi:hypothetical protein
MQEGGKMAQQQSRLQEYSPPAILETSMKSAITWLAPIVACAFAATIHAGPVNLLSANLTADVSQDLSTIGGGPTDHQEGHDTGDLTKRSVTATATASLPFGGINYGASRGNATAKFDLLNETTLTLDGLVDSTVFVKSSPFTGKGNAHALTTLFFSVTGNEAYTLHYDATLIGQVASAAKLRVDVVNDNSAIQDSVTLDAANSAQPQSGSRNLTFAPGNYGVVLDASATADPVAIGNAAGDSAQVSYSVTLQPAGSVAIPLPASFLPGAVVLTAAIIWTAGKRAGYSGRSRTGFHQN